MENKLFKKLQVKNGFQVSLINAPENAAAIFGDVPQAVSLNYAIKASQDAYLVFAIKKAEMLAALEQIKLWITEKTIVWILYPKANTPLAADLNLMQSWEELKQFDLTPCASAAIDQLWTAIRIKPVSAQKKSGLGNAELKENDYSKYIDVTNKTVTLPEDLEDHLLKYPAAFDFYQQLSYSNRKEYVLWIITAKQEKTKTERMEKMINKLLENKKNPSEK